MLFLNTFFASLKAIYMLIFVFVFFVYLTIVNVFYPQPNDKTLETTFYQQEAKFNHLKQMIDDDKSLDRIAPTFTRTTKSWEWPRPMSELGFSVDRWKIYQNTFEELGIHGGAGREKIDQDHECIFFYAYTSGLSIGPGGTVKGYAFCNAPVNPVVSSLDEKFKSRTTRYKKLKGQWYLFLAH